MLCVRLFIAATLALYATTAQAAQLDEHNSGPQKRLEQNPNPFGIRWLEGLPPRPPSAAPDGPNWTNSLAICAVMKDEPIEDVQEWLRYYRWTGVDHIFLTDNGSKKWSAVQQALRKEFDPGFLTLRSEAMEHAQLKVYAWCAEEQRDRFDWLAFFDLDEYLVLRGDAAPDAGARPNFQRFLDQFKHTAALAVHWVWVGPSGQQSRPKGGGVLQTYDQCIPEPSKHIKTIVNTFYLDGVAVHPHNFHFREGLETLTEDGSTLSTSWRIHPNCRPPWREPGEAVTKKRCISEKGWPEHTDEYNACCYEMPGAAARTATAERIALFHYATKSWEDFSAKMRRGSGMSRSKKTREYFDRIAGEQTSDAMCKEPALAYQACCSPKAVRKASKSMRSW